MIKIKQCLICQHTGKELAGCKVECGAQDNKVVNYMLVEDCPHFGENRDKHIRLLMNGISNVAGMYQSPEHVEETLMKIEERVSAIMELL